LPPARRVIIVVASLQPHRLISVLFYLLSRFRSDGDALRQRAAALRTGPKQPGPDAATSLRMAGACDDVVAMLEAIPVSDDVNALIASLTALVPLLEARAAAVTNVPPLRAVYAGAATRIREVAAAEASASFPHDPVDEATADETDDDVDDYVDDEEDVDDDELHERGDER
jgi:hypothetical protein